MELAEYLVRLAEDGAALGSAAQESPAAPVPSCPDWDMNGLVGHVAEIHHWVAGILRSGATEKPADRQKQPADPEAALAWYNAGLAELVDALVQADPDAQVWNWFARGAAPARFWYRRMAHETAVHRWDAQAAAGRPEPIDARLAVDGIDEFLTFVAAFLPHKPVPGLSGSLHLHATDIEGIGGEWSLTLAPDHLETRREHAKADAALRGPASDLLLWLVNRKPADALEAFGDPAVTDTWRTNISF